MPAILQSDRVTFRRLRLFPQVGCVRCSAAGPLPQRPFHQFSVLHPFPRRQLPFSRLNAFFEAILGTQFPNLVQQTALVCMRVHIIGPHCRDRNPAKTLRSQHCEGRLQRHSGNGTGDGPCKLCFAAFNQIAVVPYDMLNTQHSTSTTNIIDNSVDGVNEYIQTAPKY